MTEIVVIFTCKTPEDLMEVGGSGWWKINAARVRAAGRVLLVHNANDPRQPGDPKRHGQAFLYATVRGVRQDDKDGRWLIQFSKCAKTGGAFRWPGYRNPVAYMDEGEVLGALDIGEWQEMPEIAFTQAQAARRAWDQAHGGGEELSRPEPSGVLSISPRSFGAAIEAHRSQLAEELGIDPTKIRIVLEA
jgi:hypothetical protein